MVEEVIEEDFGFETYVTSTNTVPHSEDGDECPADMRGDERRR